MLRVAPVVAVAAVAGVVAVLVTVSLLLVVRGCCCGGFSGGVGFLLLWLLSVVGCADVL